MLDRRNLIAAAAYAVSGGLIVRATASCAQTGATFTPEAYGARGDGRTNDTDAFQQLAGAVNAAGGGRIVLRRTTYVVGKQRSGGPREPFAFAPLHILRLSGCTRPVAIEGNGAVLRCAPGLRYGTFDRGTGRRIDLPMPNTTPGPLATPYEYMILIERCSAGVTIQDLELDGNAAAARIGGQWGDTGWQIAAVGLFLRDNTGDEIVRNLRTHDHLQDGLMIGGAARNRAGASKLFTNVRSERNGRQGCSVIGGQGYRFSGCTFAGTGRGPISSAPGAGVDIESETAPVRNIRFDRCAFVDNSGCGMVADSGDSANVRFADCRFVGTTNWSAWPNKPGFRFARCEFVGTVVRCFSSDDPALATQFDRCLFTDDPRRFASGRIYRNGPLANLSDSRNVLFRGCTFLAQHGAQLPWSTAVIYENCVMRQSGPTHGFPRGTFRGTNRIDGQVDIAASRVQGRLTINGQVIPPRSPAS